MKKMSVLLLSVVFFLSIFSSSAGAETIYKTFTFTNLVSDVTGGPFQITGSGDVTLSVHQRTADPAYNPLVQYILYQDTVNGYSQSIFVSGTFTDTNTIRTFTNVPAGSYKIKIVNYGGASNVYGDGRIYR